MLELKPFSPLIITQYLFFSLDKNEKQNQKKIAKDFFVVVILWYKNIYNIERKVNLTGNDRKERERKTGGKSHYCDKRSHLSVFHEIGDNKIKKLLITVFAWHV
jgi:hypothetical protein